MHALTVATALTLALLVSASAQDKKRLLTPALGALLHDHYAADQVKRGRELVEQLRRARTPGQYRSTPAQRLLRDRIWQHIDNGLRWEDIDLTPDMLDALVFGGKIV